MEMFARESELKVEVVDLFDVVKGALLISLCFCGDLRAVRGVHLLLDGEACVGDLPGTLSIESWLIEVTRSACSSTKVDNGRDSRDSSF